MNDMMRAWHVRYNGESGIVVAKTPGRAKAIMVASAKSVGISVEWNNVTVRRDKRFDGLALNRERGPYAPYFAEMMVSSK